MSDGSDFHLARAARELGISYEEAVHRFKAGDPTLLQARQTAKFDNFRESLMGVSTLPKEWTAYVITGKGERKFWTKVGECTTNPDGSIEVVLESLPIDGKLHLRPNVHRSLVEPEGP